MTLRPVGGQPRELLEEIRAWHGRPDGPLVVRTSGSSGRPRGVRLSHPAVLASAAGTSRRLGGSAAWVLALPVAFVAGMQVLVRSLLAGTQPVLLDEHRGDWTAALVDAERSAAAAGVPLRCTALVPTQLHRLAVAGRLPELAGFDAVLLGGAAADPDLVRAARAAGVRVVTTYGMAETCGGCVYDGTPLDGVAVRVALDGRIHLAGPVLFDGYVDDAAATAEVMVDGWLRTGDLGRLDDEGRLHVVGRADDVVMSGGVSVSLPAVEQALRRHRAVVDAAVVGVDDPEWGNRVVAVVQPVDPDAPPTLDDLRSHVARTVPRSWAPRSLVSVDQLPLLGNGKPDRLAAQGLARQSGGPPAA